MYLTFVFYLDLIFDIDESETETYVRPLKNSEKVSTQVNGKTSPEPVLQLREQPPEPPRRHPKDVAKIGLPQSFVALRPASLPVPSQIRPPLRSTSDSKPIPLPTTNSSVKMKHSSYDPRRANSQYEAELLRLVAAGTPSHRGAWKEDSKAWEMLKSGLPNSDTSATSEDEDATQVVDERDNQTACKTHRNAQYYNIVENFFFQIKFGRLESRRWQARCQFLSHLSLRKTSETNVFNQRHPSRITRVCLYPLCYLRSRRKKTKESLRRYTGNKNMQSEIELELEILVCLTSRQTGTMRTSTSLKRMKPVQMAKLYKFPLAVVDNMR